MPIDPSQVKTEDEKKMLRLKLQANDGVIVEADEDVAFQCRLIKQMLTDLGITASDEVLDEAIGVTNVNGKTLQKIIEWCTIHRHDPEYIPKLDTEDQRITLTSSDEQYMDISSQELLDVLMGANYLDIPGLIDIITQKIANMASGKTVEQLREIYCLENDFTAEEEEDLRRRFEWIEM